MITDVIGPLARAENLWLPRVLRRQTELGDVLRRELRREGWQIVNRTPFPVVCFVHANPRVDVASLAAGVQRAGNAWISTVRLPDGTPVLRACITTYRTDEDDVQIVIRELAAAARRSTTR